MPSTLPPQLNKALWWSVVLAVLGFLDATYLTIKHYLGTPIPCSILEGCEVVTTSVYSQIGPVPVALLGSLYYLTLLVLFVISIESKNPARKIQLLKITVGLVSAGFLASLGFVYIQLFVLDAICLYCMGSALSSTLLFIIGLYMVKLINQNREKENGAPTHNPLGNI